MSEEEVRCLVSAARYLLPGAPLAEKLQKLSQLFTSAMKTNGGHELCQQFYANEYQRRIRAEELGEDFDRIERLVMDLSPEPAALLARSRNSVLSECGRFALRRDGLLERITEASRMPNVDGPDIVQEYADYVCS